MRLLLGVALALLLAVQTSAQTWQEEREAEARSDVAQMMHERSMADRKAKADRENYMYLAGGIAIAGVAIGFGIAQHKRNQKQEK